MAEEEQVSYSASFKALERSISSIFPKYFATCLKLFCANFALHPSQLNHSLFTIGQRKICRFFQNFFFKAFNLTQTRNQPNYCRTYQEQINVQLPSITLKSVFKILQIWPRFGFDLVKISFRYQILMQQDIQDSFESSCENYYLKSVQRSDSQRNLPKLANTAILQSFLSFARTSEIV